MLQHDAFYIRPNHFILIQFIMGNNTPPSIIFSIHFPCNVTSGRYQCMYVISHINYFVMLLINLKFCTMKYLSEVIPLILLMFSFKTFWIGCSVILTLQVFFWLTQQGESIFSKILAILRFGHRSHRSHRSIIKIWKMCQILETKLAKFFLKTDFF